ncbi:hypothetical protein [Rhizobium leguminosarum]|uniref:hypothetical protein n=1 Tax=Rhizobium leguminosarum TaxID=384 RepID=UPI001C92033A|nr:hypothetical protein [Rhizobium leguminosarum]
MDAYLVHVLSPGDLDAIATTREAGTRIAYSEQQLSGWILAVQGVVAYLKGQPRSGGKIGIWEFPLARKSPRSLRSGEAI